MTVAEIEDRMSAAELTEWQAEYLLRAQERELEEAKRRAEGKGG